MNGAQQSVGIFAGPLGLQLLEQIPASTPRLLLEPALQLPGHLDQWIGTTTLALLAGFAGGCRSSIAAPPRRSQAREECLQWRRNRLLACQRWAWRISEGTQPLLRSPDVAQQTDRIKPGKDLA